MESEFIVSSVSTLKTQMNCLTLKEKGNILTCHIVVRERVGSFTG